MTGPRDLSAEWAAVYGAAYVALYVRDIDSGRPELCHPDSLARDAAAIADEAVRALHRVRGQEGA